MSQTSQSYYDEIRGRIMAVFIDVADLLPSSTRDFVTEELDANELGVALQAIVEVLAEVGGVVTEGSVAEMEALAKTMGMELDVGAVTTRSAS